MCDAPDLLETSFDLRDHVWVVDYLCWLDQSAVIQIFSIAKTKTIVVCKLTTVCVTYNPSSYPDKYLCDCKLLFSGDKPHVLPFIYQLYSFRRISSAVLCKADASTD